MRAYITSMDEPTTELCKWSLERSGFEVKLLNDSRVLAEKLKAIYENVDEDFIRVDADVVSNKYCTEKNIRTEVRKFPDAWWVQFCTFDWFQQATTTGGIQFIKKEALPALRLNIKTAQHTERPESEMSRIKEFYEPRRFETSSSIMGLHGYKNDLERVKEVKARRNQLDNYDFELAERLNRL